jgi:hypothetical protein
MRKIEPFSKEMIDGGTVSCDDDGCRTGFLDHVKMTKAKSREAIPHMAGFYPDADTLERTSGGNPPAHPEFRNTSDDGLPSFPAPFSKTTIKGEPKRTAGH